MTSKAYRISYRIPRHNGQHYYTYAGGMTVPLDQWPLHTVELKAYSDEEAIRRLGWRLLSEGVKLEGDVQAMFQVIDIAPAVEED